MMGALTFVLRDPLAYSRLVFVCAWLASLPAIPLMRTLVRSAAARQPWWGYQVVVIGASPSARSVLRTLIRQPELGLRPVAVFDDDCSMGHTLEGVPVLGTIDMAPRFAERAGINRAIVVVPDIELPRMQSLVDLHARTFSHVYMLPGLEGLSSVGVEIKDVSRNLALEVRANLLMAGPRAAKRAVDLVLATTMLVLLAPLFLLLAVLIKLDSRGPVLYRQGRIGQGQTRFRVWKFRSMCRNADQVLAEYLERYPLLEREWQREHKLKNDPRITRVGRFLRKTSLDELPQLFNVLKGEMSLVGPRPIVDSEVQKYGDSFSLYLQVIPGLTGLWQVSGRNECTYQERVELDNYYVRNWSPWLDLYLLARTVKVVATGYGAY
jgi:Undecaprenyl-phosphate galactose phosphotransferase WbaP